MVKLSQFKLYLQQLRYGIDSYSSLPQLAQDEIRFRFNFMQWEQFFFIFVCVCVCMDKVLQPGSLISLQAYNCFGTNLAAVLFVFCVRTTSTSSQHWLYAFFFSFVSEVVFIHAKEKWQLFFLTRAILSIDPFGSATKGKACFIYIKIGSRGIRFRPEQHRSSLLIFNFLVRFLYLFENRTRLLNFMFNLEVETASYNLIYNVLNNTS